MGASRPKGIETLDDKNLASALPRVDTELSRTRRGADHDDEISPYTEEAVERIVDAAEDWERSLITVYFFTGLRRGEVIGLTWNNVFLDRDYLIVAQTIRCYRKTKPRYWI